MAVKLRFVELDSNKIFNWLNPKNVTCWGAYPEWHDMWWTAEIIELRERYAKFWMEEFDKITNHFSKLEESIIKSNIHHPISIVSGVPIDDYFRCNDNRIFPPEKLEKNEMMLHTRVFGGSRLTIAQKKNIKIPCVVHDFSNIFNENEEITIKNYTQRFDRNYMFTDTVPKVRLIKHTHLTDVKYNAMNVFTRQAQSDTCIKAKELMDV